MILRPVRPVSAFGPPISNLNLGQIVATDLNGDGNLDVLATSGYPTQEGVYTFLGNNELLRGNYAKAREFFNASLAKQVKSSAPFGPNYGLAFAYIYQGDIKSAVKTLEAYAADYQTSTQQQNFPAVFIWNSIARLHLEYGKPVGQYQLPFCEKVLAAVAFSLRNADSTDN